MMFKQLLSILVIISLSHEAKAKSNVMATQQFTYLEQNVPADPNNCDVDSTWVHENIKYQCYLNGTVKGYGPLGCIDGKNNTLTPGQDYVDQNFRYQCHQLDESIMVYDIVSCFTPRGTEFQPSQQVFEDSGTYSCVRLANGFVTRTYNAETACTFNGKQYAENDEFPSPNDTTVLLYCEYSNGIYQVKAQYCIGADGTETKVGSLRQSDGKTLQCVRDSTNQLLAHFLEVQQGCVDEQGNSRSYSDKWIVLQYQYQCVLSNKTAKINKIACVQTINGKQEIISTNGLTQATDKNYYWCQNIGRSTNYAIVPVAEVHLYCNVNKTIHIVWKTWDVGNLRYKCNWSSGKVRVEVSACLTNDNKTVNIHDIEETDTKNKIAHKCESTSNGLAVWRQLTNEEYQIWKRSVGGNVAESINDGSGNQPTPNCISGYKLDGENCIDINECIDGVNGQPVCDNNSTCFNEDGSFKCQCNIGFQMTQLGCIDLDECAEGVDTCSSKETCMNKIGSYSCARKTGFLKKPHSDECVEIDV